jgi:cyanophycin synthetase
MELSRIRALRGPNLWSRRTAIEVIVRLSPHELDLGSGGGLVRAIRELFPEFRGLTPPADGSPLSLAHALEVAALSLQVRAGIPVTFSRTAATVEPGVFQVVFEYAEEEVGRTALAFAAELLAAASTGGSFSPTDRIERLRELDADLRLGPSTGAIVQAAVDRGIPYRRLTTGSLVQLGWGSQRRRIQAAEMDSTSAIAESLAQDKELTKGILRASGIPVPEGRVVEYLEQAWPTAQALGLPVVVKPLDGNHGRGVTVNIETRDHLEKSFHVAKGESAKVIIETYIPGKDYRLLVVGDRLVAAARREPPCVVGDGRHTIRELADEVNRDPRRGDGHATSLTRVRIDEIATARLALQGLTSDSVPARGQRVLLRHNANLSTGGTATDVTDEVHPAIAQRAVDAAMSIGLDVCGVDLVCETLQAPLEEQGGAIIEVNAAPGLRMHLAPSYGAGRPVGKAIIDAMFAPGTNGRIPVVAVTGTNGKTTTVRLIAHIFAEQKLRVGMTTTDGIYIDGDRMDTGDCSGPKSARAVLSHPNVDAAVLETARGGILREGLAFDRCQVAVVTNIGTGDHLGLSYITTVEDLAVLKRVIVQNVDPNGYAVLNLDDALSARLDTACPGKVAYFSRQPDDPRLATHRALGRRLAIAENGDIVLCDNEERARAPLSQFAITGGGRLAFQVENLLAAAAAGWCAGLDPKTVLRALETFEPSQATTPGRFNEFRFGGARVFADYGHNPDAMNALVQAMNSIPAQRRTVVISGAGDRRDEDIVAQTRILAPHFDRVILYQDACQRGRADGEVIGLLRRGIQESGRRIEVLEVRGELAAIDLALGELHEGDTCLILVDQVELALAHLGQREKEGLKQPRQVARAR